jgi:PAS domain S-box-containing protein
MKAKEQAEQFAGGPITQTGYSRALQWRRFLPLDTHYHAKTYTRKFLPLVRVKKRDAGFQKTRDARADSGGRQRTEEALLETEQRLQDILDNTTAVVFVKDLELRYILVNREYERRHRVQRDQIRGKTDFDIHPHDVAGTLRANDRYVIEGGEPIQFEEAVPMTEGERQYVVLKFLLRDRSAKPYAICGIATDITERKRAEEKLADMNRTLQTLYQCDQALVRATEEYDLSRSVCRTLVEVGGLRMAWVGYCEFNEDKTVRPVAHAGYEAGYLERVNITWRDTDRGRGPVGTAIRTGTTSWNRGILSDPNMAPWRAEALRRRYGCCISLPLMSQGKAFGALALYAEELDAFNESAIQQYTDLANNLAYGVMALRTREERNLAESEIRQLNVSLEKRVAERTIELVRSNEQLKRAEEQLRKHGEQMQIHRDVLLELARSDKSDLEKALEKICSLSAATLEVARVSYWSLQENDSVIACEVLYLRTAESCDEQFKGTRLGFSGCPAYFEALATRRPIVADRVLRHPATSGLAEDYLKPLGISSMLDAPVWVSGKVVGVLCHEHTGQPRDWSAEEIDFVSALASMVSLALEESNRARSEHLLRESEAELLRTLAREKELGQLRSLFFSMVSHEFRTPLAIIQSSAEILDDYPGQLENAERKGHLQSIRKNTQRMAALMEETLLIGSFDAGKMGFKPTPLELRTFVRRLVDEVLSATDRRCPIKFSLVEMPAKVQADGRLLRHIFMNLLQNAVKYSDAGRLVQFEIESAGPDIVCTIRDQGIGILEADQEWLFSAFHRGRNVGGRPGTGLGLVIVKRCVDLHGGTIKVDSKLGEGTSVTLRLPILSPRVHSFTRHAFEVDHSG